MEQKVQNAFHTALCCVVVGKEEGHPLSTGGVQRLPLGLESALISVCTLSNQGKSFGHKDGTFVYPHLPYFKILEALNLFVFIKQKCFFEYM